jgi:hypothetical protein
MKIKLLFLAATFFSLNSSIAQNQTINNVSIGTDGPAYGTMIKANFPNYNGGWARSYSIANESGTQSFISLGSYGEAQNGITTSLNYSYIGTSHINTYMSFLPNGNVGIGTTTPIYKLDVDGQTSLGGGITNHWVFGTNGIGSGGSGVWFDYNNAMSNTALMQAESQGIAYRNISINPYGGNVGIGTTDPKNKLSVNGTIWAKEVKVSLTDAADWVFDTNYKLKPLADVEKYIYENKHLPEIPSAEEFRQNDMNVSEMSNKLLQKIEELTLYAIEQQKELDRLKTENEKYKSLAERLSAIEKELKK